MPDPGQSFDNRQSDPNGVGPFQFDIPPLAPGDSHTIDAREREENGTKGYYVVLSQKGYDSLQVTNENANNRVTVAINEVNSLSVPASTIQTSTQQGQYRWTVTNRGTSTIAAGEISLEIEKEPYGADARARQDSMASPLQKVVHRFTGLGF